MAKSRGAGSTAGWMLVAAITCGRPASDPPPVAVGGPDSLIDAADAAYWRGETDSAAATFEAALALARERADPAAEARTLTGLGRVANRRTDYGQARQLGRRGLDLKLQHGLRDQFFESYNLLGLIAYNEGRYFEAVDLHGTARDLAQADADTTNLAKVWTNLGLSNTELGNFSEARRLFEAALPAAQATRNGLIEGRVLTNLGMLAVRTGDPAGAVPLLERGLSRLREVEDGFGEQNALGQLGTAYAAMGQPGRAIAYLDSAIAQTKALGSLQEQASNLEQLAWVYRGAGELPRALRLLEQARAINTKLELDDETGANLREAADIHASLGNLEPARRAADSALGLHRGVGARLSIVSDLLLLADLARRAGDRAAVATRLAEARTLAGQLDAPIGRARVAVAAARIAVEQGDAAEALRLLREARSDLAWLGQDHEWEVHWLTARAFALAGRLDSAAEAGRRAVAAVERVRGQLGSGLLRTSFLAERGNVYQSLVEVLLQLGRVEEAFQAADGARGRALLEHAEALGTDDGPSPPVLAEEQRQLLRQIETVIGRIDALESRDPGLVADYRGEINRLHRELERVRSDYTMALIRSEERQQRASALGGGRPSLVRVQVSLEPDEALLEYLVADERVLLFVVTSDTVAVFSSPIPRAQLAARIRITRELLGRAGPAERTTAALEALFQTLLAPAWRSVLLAGRRTLIVVPHAELTYVPFEALRDAAARRYLVEDVSLLHLPSAASLPLLRGGGPALAASAPAVGLAPFPGELPGTRAEVEALRRVLEHGRAVIGGDATERRLRTALRESAVVHVASHGVLNAGNPMFSRLELAPGRGGVEDDGRFEIHELSGVRIAASLVVLSGCETGLGPAWSTGFARGEDYATLAQSFLHAGAANVIAALWRIEDEGAARLVTEFYRQLFPTSPGLASSEADRRIAEALGRAQRELLRDPRYRSPYYWAGFRLTGSGTLARFSAQAQGAGRLSVPSESNVAAAIAASRHPGRAMRR